MEDVIEEGSPNFIDFILVMFEDKYLRGMNITAVDSQLVIINNTVVVWNDKQNFILNNKRSGKTKKGEI